MLFSLNAHTTDENVNFGMLSFLIALPDPLEGAFPGLRNKIEQLAGNRKPAHTIE